MRCTTTHLQVIATEDSLIEVDNRRVSIPKGISVLEVKPGWNVELANGVTAYDLPANAFFFSRSNNDKEFKLLKEKLDLITSNIAQNQSVISGQLASLALDVADIKATGAKSAEVSAIISRLDNLSGNGDSVTLSQFNELSGQVSDLSIELSEARAILETKKSKIVFQDDTEILDGDSEIINGVEYPKYLRRFHIATLNSSGTTNFPIALGQNIKIIDYNGFMKDKDPQFPKYYKIPHATTGVDTGIRVTTDRINIVYPASLSSNRDTFVTVWYCKL